MPTRRLATLAVHAGQHTGDASGWRPTSVPIYHSVAYSYADMAELDSVFEGETRGYVYGRYGNPTVEALEGALAALEGAEAALAYSSGMAAIRCSVQA